MGRGKGAILRPPSTSFSNLLHVVNHPALYSTCAYPELQLVRVVGIHCSSMTVALCISVNTPPGYVAHVLSGNECDLARALDGARAQRLGELVCAIVGGRDVVEIHHSGGDGLAAAVV